MGRRRSGAAPEVRVDRGYARVWIGGRFHSLGPCPSGKPTAEHLARVARLWQDQLTGNRAPPSSADRRARSPAPPPNADAAPSRPLSRSRSAAIARAAISLSAAMKVSATFLL
jgi:hypothetical protein